MRRDELEAVSVVSVLANLGQFVERNVAVGAERAARQRAEQHLADAHRQVSIANGISDGYHRRVHELEADNFGLERKVDEQRMAINKLIGELAVERHGRVNDGVAHATELAAREATIAELEARVAELEAAQLPMVATDA